jgi:hypothetical protein
MAKQPDSSQEYEEHEQLQALKVQDVNSIKYQAGACRVASEARKMRVRRLILQVGHLKPSPAGCKPELKDRTLKYMLKAEANVGRPDTGRGDVVQGGSPTA